MWDVFSAVEQWPDWAASVDRVTPLDGPALQIGRRFEIKQPRLPKIVWEVTSVKPGASWIWRQRSLGATTFASHDLTAESSTRTVARQRIEQRGPLGVIAGLLTRRLTRRYLQMEGDGLKARSEQRARANASIA